MTLAAAAFSEIAGWTEDAHGDALAAFKAGRHPDGLLDWDSLRDVVGFNAYYAEDERYRN